MKNFFLFSLLIVIAAPSISKAQDRSGNYSSDTDKLFEFSESITADFLRNHLRVIANDSLRGRDTGTPGIEKAENYIADFYRSIGFQPKGANGTYFQPFELNATVTDSLVYTTYRVDGTDSLQVNHSVEAENFSSDFIRSFGGAVPIEGDIIYAGFGVEDSLNNIHNMEGDAIAGNWVLIFDQIPYVVEGDTLVAPNYTARDRLIALLQDHGAQGILLISDQSESDFNKIAEFTSKTINVPNNLSLAYRANGNRAYNPPYAYTQISPDLAAEILGVSNEEGLWELRESTIENMQGFRARQTPFYLKYAPHEEDTAIEARNVLAYLEGTDPELKDEVVVIMGHHDHVGVGTPNESGDFIYNGADDNGSGTTGLMAIANAFHQAEKEGFKPKRSILFLHVSAEESGLLGSRYYSDHPIIPIEQTIAALNTDMISRSDPEHMEAGNTDYVYLIGGEIISSQLDSLVVNANEQTVNMQLDRKYNDLNDSNQFYRRSDHWNFGRLGVPFVFFFTGVHEDYHAPGDEVDGVDFEKYPRVARLIYNSAVNIANFEGVPKVDNQQFIEITGERPR